MRGLYFDYTRRIFVVIIDFFVWGSDVDVWVNCDCMMVLWLPVQ